MGARVWVRNLTMKQGMRYRDSSTGAIVMIAEIKEAGIILDIQHDDPRKAGGRLLEAHQVEDMIREHRLVRLWDF